MAAGLGEFMLVGLYAQLTRKMDSVFEAYLGPDSILAGAVGGAVGSGEPEDIPKRNTNVWLLGKRYNAIQGETHRQCNFNAIYMLDNSLVDPQNWN